MAGKDRRKDDDRVDASELARAIRRGNADAERQLVEQYRPGVLYILQREGVDRDSTDDLAQETFRITIERLRGRGVQHPEKLAAFVVGITRRLLKAHRRLGGRLHRAPLEALDQLIDPAPAACDEAIRAEEAGAIRAAIQGLPVPRDRELLMRRYLLEEDNCSICRALGLTLRQLDKVLYRARLRLKRKLDELHNA